MAIVCVKDKIGRSMYWSKGSDGKKTRISKEKAMELRSGKPVACRVPKAKKDSEKRIVKVKKSSKRGCTKVTSPKIVDGNPFCSEDRVLKLRKGAEQECCYKLLPKRQTLLRAMVERKRRGKSVTCAKKTRPMVGASGELECEWPRVLKTKKGSNLKCCYPTARKTKSAEELLLARRAALARARLAKAAKRIGAGKQFKSTNPFVGLKEWTPIGSRNPFEEEEVEEIEEFEEF